MLSFFCCQFYGSTYWRLQSAMGQSYCFVILSCKHTVRLSEAFWSLAFANRRCCPEDGCFHLGPGEKAQPNQLFFPKILILFDQLFPSAFALEDGAVFARRNNHTYVFGTWWSLAGRSYRNMSLNSWPGRKRQSWIMMQLSSRCRGCVLTLHNIVRGSSTTRWTWQPFKSTPWLLGPSKRTGVFVVLGSSWGWNMKAIKTTLQDSILLKFERMWNKRVNVSMGDTCKWF